LPLTTQRFADIFNGITAVNHASTQKSVEIDVAGMDRMSIHLNHAFVEVQVNTNPGGFFIQGSPHESDGISNDWWDIAEYTVSNGTALTEPVNATEPVGETAIAMAADPGLNVMAIVYIQNTATIAQGEWHRVQSVTATVLTLLDALRFEQTNADSIIWSSAEKFVAEFSVAAFKRIRVVYNHQGAVGPNVHIAGYAICNDGVVG
jgi:hypothetical protein